jgi:hypothetical protein
VLVQPSHGLFDAFPEKWLILLSPRFCRLPHDIVPREDSLFPEILFSLGSDTGNMAKCIL